MNQGTQPLYLAQGITTFPTLEQIGNQPVWVVVAFIALSAMAFASVVAVSGFFILRGLLQVVQATTKALQTQQESDNRDRKEQEDLKEEVKQSNATLATGLQQLKSKMATDTGQLRNESSGKQILEKLDDVTKDVSGSTERLINAFSNVPQATAELLAIEFKSIDEKLKILVDTAPNEELKAKIIQLDEKLAAIPKALDDCLKQNAQMNIAADASDVRHSADVATHTQDMQQLSEQINPFDANKNRAELDAKPVEGEAA